MVTRLRQEAFGLTEEHGKRKLAAKDCGGGYVKNSHLQWLV